MRAKLKVEKVLAKYGQTAEWISLVKSALQSPVMSGTLAFFLVTAIEAFAESAQQKPTAPGTSSAQSALGGTLFYNFLIQSPVGNLISGIVGGGANTAKLAAQAGSGLVGLFGGSIDFTALKIAILLYIASGGNLAGLLTSGAGFIDKLLAPAAATAAVAE